MLLGVFEASDIKLNGMDLRTTTPWKTFLHILKALPLDSLN